MQKYQEVTQNRKQIIINNFLGGISWGLGATIGVSVVLAILGIITSKIDLIPFIGSFISQILDFILQTNSHFKK